MTRQRTHSSRVLTPLYAVLGATELAVEKLADLGANATGHRADDQPEQSYSERQIFEAAASRLARELAAASRLSHRQAARIRPRSMNLSLKA